MKVRYTWCGGTYFGSGTVSCGFSKDDILRDAEGQEIRKDLGLIGDNGFARWYLVEAEVKASAIYRYYAYPPGIDKEVAVETLEGRITLGKHVFIERIS
jgi:hypothetical protein